MALKVWHIAYGAIVGSWRRFSLLGDTFQYLCVQNYYRHCVRQQIVAVGEADEVNSSSGLIRIC